MRYRRRSHRTVSERSTHASLHRRRWRRVLSAILALSGICVFFSVIIGGWWWLTPGTSPLDSERIIVLVPSVIHEDIKQIYIFKKRNNSRTPTIYALSATVPVFVRSGYGEYPLVSLVPLLQLDEKDAFNTRAALSLALGIPVQEVWTSGEAQVFSRSSGRELAPYVLTGQIQTQLTAHQKGQVFFDLWRAADVHKNLRSLDELVKEISRVFPAARQSCRIALVNASGVPGQASLLEKYLTNNGARVIRVDDQQPSLSETRIRVQSMTPECQDVLSIVQTALPFVPTVEQDSAVFAQSRAEMQVVLGEDMASF